MRNYAYYPAKRITTGTFYSRNSECFLKVFLGYYSVNIHPTVLLPRMVPYGAETASAPAFSFNSEYLRRDTGTVFTSLF